MILVCGCSFLYNDNWIKNYNDLKDNSWPEMKNGEDYVNLPLEIKNELTDHFNFIPSVAHRVFGNDVINLSRAGAGNEYIAHSVVETCCNRNDITDVFVLWTGLHRLDLALSNEYETNYKFVEKLNNTQWYLSGGLIGTWLKTNDLVIKNLFKLQYSQRDEYLLDRTLYNIVTTQEFLKSKNINYKFGFIYDIYKDNLGLGKIDQQANLYKALDQQHILNTYPHEWGFENNELLEDGFHLTEEGMVKWLETIKGEFLND